MDPHDFERAVVAPRRFRWWKVAVYGGLAITALWLVAQLAILFLQLGPDDY